MNILKTSILQLTYLKHIHCPAFTKEQIPFLPDSVIWHDSELSKCLSMTVLSNTKELHVHKMKLRGKER